MTVRIETRDGTVLEAEAQTIAAGVWQLSGPAALLAASRDAVIYDDHGAVLEAWQSDQSGYLLFRP